MEQGKKRKQNHDIATNKKTKKEKAGNLVCELCKVELPNESSMRQHLLGQKHRKMNSAEAERERIERKCGLFVRGVLPTLDHNIVLDYFSKYGKIVWVHFGHSFLLLDYADPSTADKVMQEKHSLGGNSLTITHRKLREQVQINTVIEEDSNDIIGRLQHVENFDDQVQMLIDYLQPKTQNQFAKYRKLCDDLHYALSHSFPYCYIHPFGSTITGLFFKNSDVDVYISGIKSHENDTPYLYKIKGLLLKSRLFSKVIVIPKAKIPILKCIHIRFGISCDINLKNMLGVCNSHLIKYVLSIDPKIRSLIMIIKYWAKVHTISGQNNFFSNYSLIMLFIFFLQHGPYCLPSVFSLQRDTNFANFQDGWNGGFVAVPIQLNNISQTPLITLLKDFFKFYSEFDYGSKVICPFLGISIKKSEFLTPETLPGCFDDYKAHLPFCKPLKVDTNICIQDPFEHTRNITPIISDAILNKFVSFCRLGLKYCAEFEKALLYKILTEIPRSVKSEVLIESAYCQFSVTMQPSLKYIEEKSETLTDRQSCWFNSVVKFTSIVLKDFLKFEVSEVDSCESKNKNTKKDSQLDVYESDKLLKITFNCTAKINLWQSRKTPAKANTSDQSSEPKSIIDKEIAITEQLSDLYKGLSQTAVIINFEITIEQNVEPPSVVIKLTKIAAYKNSFKSFSIFFSANLPIWFKMYEKEQNALQNVNN